MLYISLLVILGVVGGLGFLIYKNPKLRTKLNLNEIVSYFKHKKQPFSSEEDLKRIVDFIKASKEEEHTEKQISLSLLKKGWTKTQVSHAIKKSAKKDEK